MGQYWKLVNLDKKEYVKPFRIGSSLKLWEHLANAPGTGTAMIILLAAMPEPRGGGDFDMNKNWHGPERTSGVGPGAMPEDYPAIAKRTIGRWVGDRVMLMGDYAEDEDVGFFRVQPRDGDVPWSKVYRECAYQEDIGRPGAFRDISEDVAAVIEHELGGKFEKTEYGTWQWKEAGHGQA